MIKSKLAIRTFVATFLGAMVLAPAMAFAQEAAAEPAQDWRVGVARALSAGLAMSASALSAGYAQSRIGAAAAGTLAERPEVSIWLIVLQALPEVIVLLGFVIAFMISA